MPYVVDRKIVEDLASKLVSIGEATAQTTVQLAKGERIHLIQGLKVRDPVTGDPMILIYEEDVTQTVLQEKENYSYRISSKLKDEFLALSSHELKSPLHAIIGLAEQLHDELQLNKITEESFKNISLIIESGKRMSLLVNDILDLARLTRSDVVLHKSIVNVNSMVSSVLELARPILRGIKQNHADVTLELINDVPIDIFASVDRHRLHQVLQNLVSNAIKFTDFDKEDNCIKITAER
jgi:signal transduction histidine kinase